MKGRVRLVDLWEEGGGKGRVRWVDLWKEARISSSILQVSFCCNGIIQFLIRS